MSKISIAATPASKSLKRFIHQAEMRTARGPIEPIEQIKAKIITRKAFNSMGCQSKFFAVHQGQDHSEPITLFASGCPRNEVDKCSGHPRD